VHTTTIRAGAIEWRPQASNSWTRPQPASVGWTRPQAATAGRTRPQAGAKDWRPVAAAAWD
jgi:hypothetical protein